MIYFDSITFYPRSSYFPKDKLFEVALQLAFKLEWEPRVEVCLNCDSLPSECDGNVPLPSPPQMRSTMTSFTPQCSRSSALKWRIKMWNAFTGKSATTLMRLLTGVRYLHIIWNPGLILLCSEQAIKTVLLPPKLNIQRIHRLLLNLQQF